MAMTVGGTNPYVSNYNRIHTATQNTTQKIATGTNYPSASFGASAYAIAVRLMSNIGATSQSIQNTQNMSAMVKVAEGATKNTIDNLEQIQSYLIDAANDSNDSLDRQAIQKGINQSIAQIDSNAYVQYNGMNLLDGSKESLTVAGIDGYRELELGDLRAQSLGLTDAEGNVTIDATTSEGAASSLKVVSGVIEMVKDLDGRMREVLNGGISLESALDKATTQGALQQRLEFQGKNYAIMNENQLAALSYSSDANIAELMTDFRRDQVLARVSLFGAKMFNHNWENALRLLK